MERLTVTDKIGERRRRQAPVDITVEEYDPRGGEEREERTGSKRTKPPRFKNERRQRRVQRRPQKAAPLFDAELSLGVEFNEPWLEGGEIWGSRMGLAMQIEKEL